MVCLKVYEPGKKPVLLKKVIVLNDKDVEKNDASSHTISYLQLDIIQTAALIKIIL